jgi:gamma-glutamyltranspeptidase/glutathione hydrolase
VASPHHLASAAGLAVLARGGNALDAAVATNLALGVVTPYLCGFGGDLFALVWRDDRPLAYNGSGRAPAAATVEAVRDSVGTAMPTFGPHTVTVPGAVEAWFALLERFGSRPFEELARPALRFAEEGFPLSDQAARSLRRARALYRRSNEWHAVYGGGVAGLRLRQAELARTIRELSTAGPETYYRGRIAEAVADHLASLGGLMRAEDLAEHCGEWIDPIRTGYREVEVLELPPNTQGVAALEALNVIQAAGALPPDGPDRHHLMIEAVKLALADRDDHVTDPGHMRISVDELLSHQRADRMASSIDRLIASRPHAGRAAAGGTAYICAADRDGTMVSLIQSNYMGFGSGITVPGWGINLQNRGAFFSLDDAHPNVIAARKRTLHTLIPAMALRGGRPWLVFGSMGGDGQAQTHVQVLVRMVDDREDPQRAITAPRWVVSPAAWSVAAESRFDDSLLAGLRDRGHDVTTTGPLDSLMGHAHAIVVTDEGYAGATDPRAEGAVLGL